MNVKMVGRFLAQILALEAVFMLPSVALGFAYGNHRTACSFLIAIGIESTIAAVLSLLCRGAGKKYYAREGLVCVGLSWIVMSLVGCLPFCLSGEIPSYIDAFFEMVSGFTTTGASVVPDVESLSRAVLYWRSFSHWLGGMGVLVFLLAFSSTGGKNGGFSLFLLRAESPGPTVGKLVPKMKQSATILYLLYIVLTVLNFVFLLLGGMNWFEAICTALGTAGTGGFGVKADSIASYSPYLQNVCTVFMLLFGVNFNLYFLLLLREFRSVWKNEEIRLYIGTVVISAGLIAWNIRGLYATFGETLRHAFFQVASVITTTGFATADFNLWPDFSKAILLVLMIFGACAGSTGGGIKCARVLLLFKSMIRSVRNQVHPTRVTLIRSDGEIADEKTLSDTSLYLVTYVFLLFGSFLAVSLDGFSLETNLSAVMSCLNNIGPGFDGVGPMSNYAGYSAFSKLVLIFDMLAGRLELYPILALFARRS